MRQTAVCKASGLNEEPPHDLDQEALEIALTVALMTNTIPVDETHVMRKVVIDGSSPYGFQRTAIVALNGGLEVDSKQIPIQTICVEEDACRKTGEKGSTISYRLDRLGVPLIEVVTGPVIDSPKQAEEVALALGRILRATGRVKRGIGTIRQDLNISITGGALVEIKGVQELELVSTVVANEVQRQLTLLKIRDELVIRGVKEGDFKDNIIDVTKIFTTTKCRVIEEALENGCKVMAVVLPKLSGLLRIEVLPGIRFGTELSDYAKFWGRVGGIFHTDELPSYGITEEEVSKLEAYLKTANGDTIIFVADADDNAIDALKAVVGRMKTALVKIPSETRAAYPEGTTRYSRPRPGAARMYPETDIPPVPITMGLLKKIRESLPEPLETKLTRLMNDYGLNRKLASQVLNSDYYDVLEKIVLQTKISASFIAATLTETFKNMERRGIDVNLLSENLIEGAFTLADSGTVAKEAIPEILTWMIKHEGIELNDAVEVLGLGMASEEELAKIVDRVVKENAGLIQERKINALGPLMGVVMKDLRGKIDAKKVSQLIKKRIEGTF
ncbi:MAG: Glu-tRNA(Gln) amidotransferase subunit GatE [Candidatus Bathyarchaeota archaeon]